MINLLVCQQRYHHHLKKAMDSRNPTLYYNVWAKVVDSFFIACSLSDGDITFQREHQQAHQSYHVPMICTISINIFFF